MNNKFINSDCCACIRINHCKDKIGVSFKSERLNCCSDIGIGSIGEVKVINSQCGAVDNAELAVNAVTLQLRSQSVAGNCDPKVLQTVSGVNNTIVCVIVHNCLDVAIVSGQTFKSDNTAIHIDLAGRTGILPSIDAQGSGGITAQIQSTAQDNTCGTC